MIYVGPFTGEIGYELLYWIPSVAHKFRDKLDDIVAISRGGNDSWYPCKVLNAYDVVDPDFYREAYLARKKTTGEFKQLWPDDKLDHIVMERLGVTETAYHPSAFYHRLGHGIGLGRPSLPIKPVERYPGLPEEYVAVRFYENDFLKNCKPNFVEQELPSVALVPKETIDNHDEIPIQADHIVEYGAKDSLETITRVVAHAKMFVGTYGGLSYIGPLCGVPTRVYARDWSPNKHTPAEERLGPLFQREKV